MDVWKHTTSGDGGANHAVELFVASNRKLQVSWCDALQTHILGGIARQLKHLGGEVLQDGRCVDGGLGTDADMVLSAALQVTVDTSDRELIWAEQ